jgi:hypothetical protein
MVLIYLTNSFGLLCLIHVSGGLKSSFTLWHISALHQKPVSPLLFKTQGEGQNSAQKISLDCKVIQSTSQDMGVEYSVPVVSWKTAWGMMICPKVACKISRRLMAAKLIKEVALQITVMFARCLSQ